MKKAALCILLLFGAFIAVAAMQAQNARPTDGVGSFDLSAAQLSPTASGSYPITGKPTVRAAQINAILAAYHSPARGLGQYLYDEGVKYGIDPVHVLAIFLHESEMGTTGEARKTMSPGNERCLSDRPCVDTQLGGYAQMESWQDGFAHLYALLYYGYIEGQVTIPLVGHRCVTVAQIVPVFAPSGDRNDVAAYIANWVRAVITWRAGRVLV
ncbi:MAG: hypothetical protein WCD86_16990 [Ktedonobacteraceae bacterium]